MNRFKKILLKLLRKSFFIHTVVAKLNLFLFYRINYKILFYDLKKDLLYNLFILKKICPNYQLNIKNNTNIFKHKFHYEIFEALKKRLGNQKLKILEIGTYDGRFTNHLSQKFSNSKIYTIDLKKDDSLFLNSYKRNNKAILLSFLNERKKNLNKKNILFYELNSIFLKKKFKKEFFDIIFVDGDHSDPVVTIDILNSYDLVKKGGFVIVDDILKKNRKKLTSEGSSFEAFKALKKLEKIKKIKTYFVLNFIRPHNFFSKSYIGFFQK
jgi:predicted O-methyltransferase YrrM